ELIAEYRTIATKDSSPPTSLWKGVIVLDSDQSPLEIYPAYQHLIEDLMTGFIHQLVENKNTLSVTPEPLNFADNTPRISIFVTPSQGPADLLDELDTPRNIPIEDPFIDREQDGRTLTLYVSVPSPTSSGITAAHLSRNWHLLHHIKECMDTSSTPTEIVWLDLMGDYKTDELLEQRFGLETLHKQRRISQEMYRDLTNTLWSTRFLDLSHNIDEVLTEGSDAFDKLCFNVSAFLPEREEGKYIIVLDGWEEFQGMVPGHQQHLIRTLEQKLLDTFPQSDCNIIWIDGGTHHTRMNIHYQRKCVTPLRYDSLRRTHLDEIIYNLPTAPRQFWWMNPQQEDVRIIVQDTPTQATPWRATIHVPQLVGFTETFRGLARRDGIVAPEDVVRDGIKIQSMHGRGVTLSSIMVSDERLSTHSNLLDHALTLVPTVLRQRQQIPSDSLRRETQKREPHWKSVVQTVNPSARSSISDRMSIDVTRPPPRPRGSRRYIYTLSTPRDEGITRPWRYEQTPQQMPEDDVFKPPTYTPMGEDFEYGEIDTIKNREQELRRIYYAARHLKDQRYVSKKLRQCCTKIERYCAKQLSLFREEPSLKTSVFLLGALLGIKKIILEDPKRKEVWIALLPLREKLLDLLNLQNRELLQDSLDECLDLFTLYGNNLFLAVLAALGSNSMSVAEGLWTSVAEWTFYQIGLHIHDNELRTIYSFQALLSNLRSRAKILSNLRLPERSMEQEQIGAILWEESESGYNALLLIPQEDGRFVTGLIEGLRSQWLTQKHYWCNTTPQELRKFAQNALASAEKVPVVCSRECGTLYVWIPVQGVLDGEIHWTPFTLEHGRPSGRYDTIPWLRLETPTTPQASPSHIPPLPDSIQESLLRIGGTKHRTIPVEVMVSVNEELEVYEVELEGGSQKEKRVFLKTRELIRFLRTPVRESGLRSFGKTLTWDHRKDITYVDSLSFLKPLVHRSRFFPDEFHVPDTCKELLAATPGEGITLLLRPEGKNFRVEFVDLLNGNPLKGLEEIELDFHTMGLLTECTEIYDPIKRTLHSVTLNIDAIMDLTSSNLHKYAILEEALQNVDTTGFDWSRGTWRLSAQILDKQINWSILSTTTGNPWMRETYEFTIHKEDPPSVILEEYRAEVERVVPLSRLQ
ncbi:MAG: hypothetical protein P1Q69_17435, partial [Candidatus Thorarchaeota archaeon]|nr:hypothetical protein [Candidatus Thorarchaeota archaeon]